MNPLGLRCLFALAALHLLTAQSGYAAGRVSTRQSGIVVSVDQARRSFAVRPDGEAEEVVIEWRTKSEFFGGSKTEFFAGADPADSAILKKGIRVFVKYREALFVPNAAILVRWLKPATEVGRSGPLRAHLLEGEPSHAPRVGRRAGA